MSQTHREIELLEALRRLGGSARNTDLAKALDVSEETVRRTIKSLSRTAMVARVRGGAYLVGTQNDPSFFRRITQRPTEKRLIANVVSTRVSDGMTLFLDVGSTTAFVAEELRRHQNLTIATNSIGVAQTLVNVNGNRVHILGGEMQANERGAFGHVTHRQAQRLVYDMAILSADAVSPRRGFLYHSNAEAELAQIVAECADQILIAFDHGKLSESAPFVGPAPRQISHIVTDKAPSKALAQSLDAWGIKAVIADGSY
ncbi:DeoR/GlpR family DNA-binding transcription regulator [Ruegeria conchae]|uniref:DeoR/GlpR family DNA-binding transcription regulator n=1 Tax=Ruegeria conchae TaxID=981384 RepID=UPI0029C7E79D|nr:DeoR/GlpR family DNA-binding transcription regulator [Ruegeria conchae]